MQNRLFSQVRQSCAYVAENARHITINKDFLADYARSLPVKIALNPVMDAENHLCEDPELTLAYFMTLDCINFGSGYFSELCLDTGKSGYFTVASRLKQEILKRGSCLVSWLQQMSAEECCRVFGQKESDFAAYELMRLFAQALRDFAELLFLHYEGSFVNLIRSAGNSAARLAEILCQMPFYRDSFNYEGHEVLLLKRAQITASDLHLAFRGSDYGYFADIVDLTIFADNLVPHVLAVDGLLQYSPDLQNLIKAGTLLRSGSIEEIEIRACAVHAVELLRQAFADVGVTVSSQQLDYLLWNRGQASRYNLTPTHQTRCVYY